MTNPAGCRQREMQPLAKRPLLEEDGERTMDRIGQAGGRPEEKTTSILSKTG
jgi:hypothetical protein